MIILGLGLGEVATIGVGTSVLICEGLGGDLLVDYDRGRGVCRGSVDHRGVVDYRGVVDHRGMVDGLVGVGRDGGNVAGLVLLLIVVLVDLAGLGRGLAVDGSGVRAVGLGDGGGDGGGVALLEGLVVHLVGGGDGEEGGERDKGLQDEIAQARVTCTDTSLRRFTSHTVLTRTDGRYSPSFCG